MSGHLGGCFKHVLTLSKLELIIRSHSSRTDSAESSLGNNLKVWFLEHAIKYDAHLKAVFQAMYGQMT